MLIGYLTGAYSQYTTSTFYPSMDAHVASGASANTNFGSNQYIQAFHQIQQQTQTVYRSYLQFDLSSIPTNAIIIDAQLKLTPYYQDNTGSQNDLYIQRVDSLWTDSTITWNNQPIRINSNQVSIPHNQTTSTSQHSYGVRNFIQHMVNNPHLNKGLAIQLQNEQDTHAFGLVYYSNDAQAYKPELEVFWMDPIDVSFDVTHCTNGNSDGSVDVSFNYSGTPRSIILYKFERDTTVDVKTNSTTVYSYTNYPSKTNHTINNLAPGVYGVITFDSTYYTNGNLLDCRLDKYFLVGEEGEVTEGLFSTTSFHEMTQLSKNKRDSTESLTHWEDMNGWEISTVALNISETRYPPQTSTEWQYVNKSLMEYPIDWDPGLIYDEAMFGGYAYTYFQRYANSTNDVYYYPITEDWQYKKVTWNTQPEVDTSTYIYIPTTNTIGNDPDRRDSVDLLPFVEYWQEHPNYGFRAELANQNQGDFANRGYRRPYSNNTGFLQVSFRVKPKIETTFDEETYLGEITVNAPAGDLPYTYLISEKYIPGLDTIWNNVKDSLGMDSIVFFQGKTQSRNHVFGNLVSDKYFVAVFDNSGDKIMMEEVYIEPEMGFYQNSNLSITNNSIEITQGQSSGVASLDLFLKKSANAGVQFEIISLGEAIIGFNQLNEALISSRSDLEFGIEISSSGYYEFFRSDTIVYEDTLQEGDQFALVRMNNTIYFYQNREFVASIVVPQTFNIDYKVDIKIPVAGMVLAHAMPVGLAKKVPPYQVSRSKTNCDYETGVIRISRLASTMYPLGSGSGTYSVTEFGTSTVVDSGSLTDGVTDITDLPFGAYEITISFSGTFSTTYTEVIYLGTPVEWEILNDNYVPVVSSLNKIVGISSTEYGNAISHNQLLEGEDGWFRVSASPKKWFSDVVGSTISNSAISFLDETSTHRATISFLSLGGGILTQFLRVSDDPFGLSYPIPLIYSTDGPVTVYKSGTNFNFYHEESTTPFTSISGAPTSDYRVFAMSKSSMVFNASASFCSGLSDPDLCAHLDYELDGNFYVTNNGFFCFVYNEEYNDSNIEFNIYNEGNFLVATQDDFIVGDLILGENRIVLDFTDSGFCIGKGYFVLEVINDKGEKFYLRFYNDLSICVTTTDSHDGDEEF